VSHSKRITRIYYKELAGSFILYVLLLTASVRFGRPMADGAARTLVLVCPMAGFLLMLWAMARQLARKDEYMRMRLLETIGIAAGITAGLTFSYGFLESAGFPKLSMFSVWIVLAGSAGLVQCGRKLLDR
jgi:hypothetical protein